jgi:hypothetical protein
MDLARAIRLSDPLLGRYNPLERILVVDDFDSGMHGWQALFPDYDGWDDYPERYEPVPTVPDIVAMSSGDPALRIDRRILLGKRGVPMLSTLTSWDIGSQGTWDGTYALKIPTLPLAGNKGLAVKRLTLPERGKLRVETYFTYKAEPSDFRIGEHDIRSFFLAFDVMDPHHIRERGEEPVRWWPAVRYFNDPAGGRWQMMLHGSGGVMDGPWDDLPDGRQDLGFNRSPTKYQWHYLRLTFDLTSHCYVDFHCYGKEFEVAGKQHVFDPPLTGFRASTERCPGLVATIFGIEAEQDKRCFLYLDSVVVSAEGDEAGW